MKLSRTSHFAVIALVHLARHDGQSATSRDIARAEALPEQFLLKVLRALVRAGMLLSAKGPRGGYRLARPATTITLLSVIEAVDGPMEERDPDDGYLPASVVRRLKTALERSAASVRRCLAKVTIAKLAQTQ